VFDISFTELMLIGVVALVIIGPERLPKVAKTVGHLLGRAQRYVNDVKGDIQREVELDELRKMKDDMESAARSMQTSMHETQTSLRKDLQNPVDDIKTEIDSFKSDFEPQVKLSKTEPVAEPSLGTKAASVATSAEPGAQTTAERSEKPQLAKPVPVVDVPSSAAEPAVKPPVSESKP